MGFSRGPKVATDGMIVCLDAKNGKSYPGDGNLWTNLANVAAVSQSNGEFGTAGMQLPTYAPATGSLLFGQGNADAANNRKTTVKLEGDGSLIGPIDLPTYPGWSIGVWIKRTAFGTWTSGGTTNYDGIWNYYWNWYLAFSGEHTGVNAIYAKEWGSTNAPLSGGGYAIDMNRWYHIFCTHDNGIDKPSINTHWYVNGKLIDTDGASHATLDSGSPRRFYIGNWDTSWSFVGELALFRIYNKVLTAEQVSLDFDATRSRFSI